MFESLINVLGTTDFNQVWFELLITWLNAILTLLLGGDVSALQGG
jgi:hypothetical protein